MTWVRRAGIVLGAWMALTAGTWLLWTLAQLVAGSSIQAWDEAVVEWLYARRDGPLVALSHAVTDLGKPSAAVPLATFAVLAFLAAGRRRDALWILLSSVGAGATYLVLLPIFGRARPDTVDVTGLGMPSGHAVATLSVALPVAIAAWRAWGARGLLAGIPALAIAVVVGITRPYIQYHYVTDVLVAWAMTAVWVVVLDRWALWYR